MEPFTLPADLVTAMCERLGVAWPTEPPDVARLFRAWCARVPFDNVGKMLAVAEGRVPPGDDPGAVVEHHLATGLGGTCWAHVSVLSALLATAGVHTSIGLDRMARTDGMVDFHSFVVVHEAGGPWMLDPVWGPGGPLALRAGARGDHPVIRSGLDADDPGGRTGRLRHWVVPGQGDPIRYALLSTVLDRDDVRAYGAVSVRFSGVHRDLVALRRATPISTERLWTDVDAGAGADRPVMSVRRRTAEGVTDEPFTDIDAAFAAMGCTPEARRLAERAGLLRAQPRSGARPRRP
jgi:hypothetical protein